MRLHEFLLPLVLLHCTMTGPLRGQTSNLAENPAQPHTSKLTIDAQSVNVLHLRPGFVSSIRLPEEVTSVVLGNPQEFRAEHSEAEPRLVFFKPLIARAAQTNALITTRSGHEISLHLVSNGHSGAADVDFFLDYDRPHSFMIPPEQSSFSIGEVRNLDSETASETKPDSSIMWIEEQLVKQTKSSIYEWTGKRLQVSVGEIAQHENRMVITFSVLNNSDKTIELLPPQLRLVGPSKEKSRNKVKAEPVAIEEYRLTAQKLAPSRRVDGVLLFERPQFKESNEQLLIQIVQADQVDRPVLVPIPFTAPLTRTAQ